MINGTMMQYFHWYTPSDGTLWKQLKNDAPHLAELGINAVWIPPVHKGKDGAESSGYDVYDLFDIGEFDQKNSIRTKFGTKKQLKEAVKALKAHGIQVYVDIVMNHMGGADETEKIKVIRVNDDNRNEPVSEPFEIEAFTKFTFPGRQGKYSNFIWDHRCFTGVDYAHDLGETAVFSIVNEYGEGWEDVIDEEKGNYDYLMFCDLEFRNPAVREEVKKFGGWFLKQLQFDGVRLDAVKHINPIFISQWLDHMRYLKPDLFVVGEYWAPGDLPLLLKYLEAVEDRMTLFDAALHHKFHQASNMGKDFDLTTILHDSLLAARPQMTVTVVDNHDTQPLQSLEAPVEAWFKPLAYALILLRAEGYPCIFYPDLYGAHYVDKGRDGSDYEIFLDKTDGLEAMLMLRKNHAYGQQRDYFDHGNCIGWTREGMNEVPGSGCAVVLSNGDEGFKAMEIGQQHAGKTFYDYLGKRTEEIQIDEKGWAEFLVNAGSVSVWVARP